MSLIAQVFLKLLTPKMRLLKRIKGLVSENPSAENLLKNILYFTAPISKIFHKKISYIFFLKKFILKNFLMFSQKKAFVIFWETELSYILFKKFSYILRNGTFQPKNKKLLYFRRELGKTEKQTKHTHSEEISYIPLKKCSSSISG